MEISDDMKEYFGPDYAPVEVWEEIVAENYRTSWGDWSKEGNKQTCTGKTEILDFYDRETRGDLAVEIAKGVRMLTHLLV